MRLALTFFITAMIFTSCRFQAEKVKAPVTPEQSAEMELKNLQLDDLEMLVLEGCEYLIFKDTRGSNGFGFMTHKGNCQNPIHCYNNTNTSSNNE